MKRCKAKTNKGDQCKNNAIPGTNFCYLKSHRKDQAKFYQLLINFIGNHFFKIISVALTILSLFLYFHDKKLDSTTGVLLSEDNARERILAIGCSRFIIKSNDNVLLRDNGSPLLSLKIIEDKLFVSTIIRNESGEIVAELVDSQWVLNKKNFYKRNYNDEVLEVINHKGKAVLQVVNFGDVIHIACIYYCKDGRRFALIPIGKYGALMGNGPPWVHLASPFLYENPNVKTPPELLKAEINPICKYPPSKPYLCECPGLDSLLELVRMTDKSKSYKGYAMGSSLEICK